MSEKLTIHLIWAVAIVVVVFVGGLAAIAIIRDDGSENLIVTALVGSIGVGGSIISALMTHWLGSRSMTNAVTAISSLTSQPATEAKA